MSAAYGNVVSGKLKLKGRPLDVKLNGVYGGGMTSKRAKNKKKKYRGRLLQQLCESAIDNAERINTKGQDDGRRLASAYYNRLTPAERRFLQQTEKIELERLAKMASKSHRDRVQEFNQYLANPSERYDIPKVGPG
ncbi:protein FAM32A-like isoform X2 [Rhodamnia argentea]|uniref:Protein FAM32A-like isoform X2 n=1 Tax=Rhodamnia argentea TaxID=178133 RepID=A0A8B8Q483_9MYRT|nr:protein FAM32A-like isoform X2 [Rhodamnia argentea]